MSEQPGSVLPETVTNAAPALAQALGWFSIALGAAELFAGRPLARSLGMEEDIGVVRAYGLREIATGIGILTARDPAPWVWGRVAGDALDLATLGMGLRGDNPQRGEVGIALAMVAGVTALDVVCAQALGAGSAGQHHEPAGRLPPQRDFSDRTGFPKGMAQVRGAARGVTLQNPSGASRPHTAGASGGSPHHTAVE